MSYFSNIKTSGVASLSNNSTTPLNAGAIYTGTGELNTYSDVMAFVKTDQDGTLYFDFSIDGTNWDSTLTYYYDTDRINPPHIAVKGYRYFRVRFTNTSASNQTYFRLQTNFGLFNKLTSPSNSIMPEGFDSMAVRPTHYQYEVAMGRRQGRTTWNKFGYNGDLDIGTETIWASGGTFTRINTASTFTVVSSSAQDILTSGTGAWNVVIYYVDADRLAQTVVVPLNGTTPVVTAVTGLGINRAALFNTGSGDVNAGTITITATTGGTTQATIPAGEGTTQQAIFFTQANHTALMDFLSINVNKISGGGSPRVTVRGWVYSYVSTAKYLVFQQTIDTSVENSFTLNPNQPFVVGEKSIVYFEATTDTNNTIVSCRFSLIEVRNQ
jgi:hypothetical protein